MLIIKRNFLYHFVISLILFVIIVLVIFSKFGTTIQQCDWVKLNKIKEYGITYRAQVAPFSSYVNYFIVPDNSFYRGVRVLNGSVSFFCELPPNPIYNSPCFITINNVSCGNGTRGINNVLFFNQTCISAIKEGTNVLAFNSYYPQNGTLNDLYLAMEVLPTRC